MESLSQRDRLSLLTLYVVALLIISKVTLDHWLPPSSTEGLWFYGGLFALLFGDLLISPFFTKPADALSYGVTGLIALLAADVAFDESKEAFERALWVAGLVYMSAVVLASLASITFRNATSRPGRWLKSEAYRFADTYGGARPTYFIVFLLAVLVFHRDTSQDFIVLLSAGLIVLIVRPLEVVWAGGGLFLTGWRRFATNLSLGELLARQEPGIMLVRREAGSDVKPGDVVVGRTSDREVHFGLHLDWLWLAGETWARIVRLRRDPLTDDERQLLGRQAAAERAVVKLVPSSHSQAAYDKLQRVPVVAKKDRLVGIVGPDTNLGTLIFEVTGMDTDIEEGQLVETRIGDKSVLYQIIDGVSREEVLQERNSYGYARAKARKIGVWNDELGRFEKVRWIPLVNEPVLLVTEEQPEPRAGVIGYFPKTRYPVRVELNSLVTHNTAILGILGSGKTMLALELVQRMMREGIKVVCLDITGQYAGPCSTWVSPPPSRSSRELGVRGKRATKETLRRVAV